MVLGRVATPHERTGAMSAEALAMRWRGRRAVIISPHLDDAAFSCWALFQPGTGLERVQVITVCTADAPPGVGLSATTDVRRLENERFMAKSGHEHHSLGLADAAFRASKVGGRAYASIPLVFGPVAEADSCTPEALAEALAPIIAESDIVVAPLGVGGHVDHVLVARACLRLPNDCCFYEDFPYIACRTFGRFVEPEEALSRLGIARASCFWLSVEPRRKVGDLAVYESQLKIVGDAEAWVAAVSSVHHAGSPCEYLWWPEQRGRT